MQQMDTKSIISLKGCFLAEAGVYFILNLMNGYERKWRQLSRSL